MPPYSFACHTRAWKTERWEEALEEIAGLGYAGAEGVSALIDLYADKTEMARKHLQERNVKLAALAGEGAFTHPDRREEILRRISALAAFLQKLDSHHLVVETGPRAVVESISQDFKVMAATLDELGKRCLDFHDVYLCVMPRRGSRIESGEEIDRLMNQVDLDAVFLGLDTGHFPRIEEDPAIILKTYGECVRHLHFSDPVPEDEEERARGDEPPSCGGLGQGTMNFTAIQRILEEIDYRGWITVVFDAGREPPRETAGRSKTFLDQLFGMGEQAP